MTLEELKKNYPDIADAHKTEILADTGRNAEADIKTAVATERARMKAIDDMTLPGFENLANKAKYEEPITAEEFAMQLIAEQKKTGQAFLSDRQEDVDNSGIKKVSADSNNGGNKDNDPFGEIIDRLYPQTK